MDDDTKIRVKLVKYLVKNRVTGNHKKQSDTVVNKAGLAKHNHGRAKELLDEMATDPAEPIQKYGGGHRDNVRLTSIQDGVEYIEDNGGDPPWGF